MGRVVDIKDFDFSPYGRYLAVPDKAPGLVTDHSRCWGQEYTLPMGQMRFGVEDADPSPVISIDKLEQHRLSKEVVIPGNTDFVIALALPRDIHDMEEHPNAEDVVLIAIHPGDILVLDEHVWHSGCYPVRKSGHYFFMYKVRDEELYWREVIGGPVKASMEDVR